jgi:Derlin-2/3
MTGSFICTALSALDIISPIKFTFNWGLVLQGTLICSLLFARCFLQTHATAHWSIRRLLCRPWPGQAWRLLTTFLFFGNLGLDFLFHMYFLARYSRLLEEGEFHGRKADFVWFLILGAVVMLAAQPYTQLPFLVSKRIP